MSVPEKENDIIYAPTYIEPSVPRMTDSMYGLSFASLAIVSKSEVATQSAASPFAYLIMSPVDQLKLMY